jgi:hypothetical protein
MSVWYLLYDGSSEDGRGQSDYVGRTTHKEIARKHHKKVRSNPYSTGKVMIANDFKFFQADDAWFESGS